MAQGQPLKKAGMHLSMNVFAHGHMYVGMSRCGEPNKFYISANQHVFHDVEHILPFFHRS